MQTQIWRAELHAHSCYSKDSNLKLERLVAACERAGINVVGVTDHNSIEGAVALREMAPAGLHVIVGEEIATSEGDLIGLFLKERIEPRLSMADTIAQIRAQGGLVMAPHPFDRLRHEAMGGAQLERVKQEVDFVEVFNARNVFEADNRRAAGFVTKHGLHGYVCSDAHWAREYGRATCLIEPFEDAAGFARSLREAKFETRRASVWGHVGTAVVKRTKNVRRRLGR